MAREPLDAKLTSIWLGALFFWTIKGFRGKFSDLLSEKSEDRNMWTGYTISLLAFATIVYYFIKG